MNDAADEPQEPTSVEQWSLRKISQKELRRILRNHRKWLAEEDFRLKEGKAENDLDHLRADLRGVWLRGGSGPKPCGMSRSPIQLQGVNLSDARLQGADLLNAQLQDAILIGAQLQKVRLAGAALQRAELIGAQLQGADLIGAQLHMADLSDAQLQGADLSCAQLQGADVAGAQLQGAILNVAKLQRTYLDNAQLNGAKLCGAQLQRASLRGATFERKEVTAGGQPGPDLPGADLTDADFRDAQLGNAQLSTVTGLRANNLAGTVLTNAKLPVDIAKFDALAHAAETSQHAGRTFFGLLTACLYAWLTIATTTDVALIANAASSPLPIIGTEIPLAQFYWVAPLILVSVYLYLQLYLQRLWLDLSSLPAVFPDGKALDEKAYPWLLNGLVRAHFTNLKAEQRPLTRLENVVSIVLAWWVVPLTLLAFWLRFLPRHDWWGTAWHIVLGTAAVGFGMYSYRLAVRTLSGGATSMTWPTLWATDEDIAEAEERDRGGPSRWVRMWHTVRRYLPSGLEAACAGVAIIVVLSAGPWIDPGDDLLTMLGYETYADLTDDDVSTKPSDWTGREETADLEIAQVKGADLEGRDLRDADARGAFLVKAKLAEADLGRANLWTADFRGANLNGAQLDGAYLSYADLREASLKIVDFNGADLSGANFSQADLFGANLFGANLSGANLESANLESANLSNTRHLTQAQLDEACGDGSTQLPEGLTIRMCSATAPQPSPAPQTGSSASPRARAGARSRLH